MKKVYRYLVLVAGISILLSSSAFGAAAVDKWVDEFQPCVMTKDQQKQELEWFAKAAAPLKGMKITAVSEDIPTHRWEASVLTKAFEEITGIKVQHDIIQEGDVVQTMVKQMKTGKPIYDIYVNDADQIGMHLREESALNWTAFMAGKGKDFTDPYLDLPDMLNLEFGQDYDGNQLQIPDEQFVNVYWFRHDWFSREDLKKEFKAKYGYELGVPINWKAYEDIAQFFTGKTIDGKKVYGHMDYGRYQNEKGEPVPDLGWRFTDAWLSMAGAGDKGLPNGVPVDEWGVRCENRIPVGASVERGGDCNGPAGVYALTKFLTWMNKYAPPYAKSMSFTDSGTVPAKGQVAQMIFQYCTWLSAPEFTSKGSPVCDENGKPLWRVATSPHGKFWDKGMKVGYQDPGSWTLLQKSVKDDKVRQAAWLYAQFCIAKSTNLKKFIVGNTPIRKSTLWSDYVTENIDKWGGLIELYRSCEEKTYTATGRNVPYYPSMSQLWAKNIGKAVAGEYTPQQAMDVIAYGQDEIMGNLKQPKYSPKLWPKKPKSEMLGKFGPDKAPKADRPEQKGETMSYEDVLKLWKSCENK